MKENWLVRLFGVRWLDTALDERRPNPPKRCRATALQKSRRPAVNGLPAGPRGRFAHEPGRSLPKITKIGVPLSARCHIIASPGKIGSKGVVVTTLAPQTRVPLVASRQGTDMKTTRIGKAG